MELKSFRGGFTFMDEQELMSKIASGEKDAFHQLYQDAAQSVYGFALSIVKNKQDAEDILQETFIKIRENAASYKSRGKLMAWILTIARNQAMDKLRSYQKISYCEDEVLENIPDFSNICDIELRLTLQEAFCILTDDERQILLLHAVSGLKHREIAALLHKPLASVLSRYHRSLKKLQQTLTDSL